MRSWIVLAIALVMLPKHLVFAQPNDIPRPPEFQKLIGPAKFEPATLREAIAFPVASTRLEFGFNNGEKEDEIPPVEVIEKKLIGDERDAEWLLKLGYALDKKKSARARDAFERSAAAFRKRTEKEPKVAKHYLDLCSPLYELDRHAEVLSSAKRCVELDPKNADGWWGLSGCYWDEFNRLVYEEGKKVSWEIRTGHPPPKIVKPLTSAEEGRARTLLKEIYYCQEQWHRHAPPNLETLFHRMLYQAMWELFDDYFRTGVWKVDETSFGRQFLSKKLQEKLLEHGREKQDPAALGTAAISQIGSFLQEAGDPDWTPAKMTAAQKKELGATLQVLEQLADGKNQTTAVKASVILAAFGYMMDDQPTAKRYAAKALALAPRERAVIDMMVKTQNDDLDFQKFWENHVCKHPSVHAWLQLSFTQFRSKKYDALERCLGEGEKLDPKDRSIQLAKAALALKRGEASLGEAGRILDALEKRLDEPAEKDALFGARDVPSFAEAYRYLRAIHTALSGKWEQGRDQLRELREKDVLVEAIDAALGAFPRRAIIMPERRPSPLGPEATPIPAREK